MKKIKRLDIKVVNFFRKACNYYLRKRKFVTEAKMIPDKIESFITQYLAENTSINFIDIGAHKGHFVDELISHYKLQKVILIEPIKELSNFLIEKYKSEGYIVYQNALSDKSGEEVDFLINEFSETSSFLEIRSDMEELSDVRTKLVEKQKVITRTLDEITSESMFTSIDLIKVDVQGAEHLVIKGAKDTLSKTKFLWIELSFKPLYKGSSVFNEIYSQLEKEKFILLEISQGYRAANRELLQVDALFANINRLNS